MLHSTASGQFRPETKFSPLLARTRGGSVEIVTVSPSRRGPCAVAVMSRVKDSSVSSRVKVMADAGPVTVHTGHTSTSPGLVTVVAPSTRDDDTHGYGTRESTRVRHPRCTDCA